MVQIYGLLQLVSEPGFPLKTLVLELIHLRQEVDINPFTHKFQIHLFVSLFSLWILVSYILVPTLSFDFRMSARGRRGRGRGRGNIHIIEEEVSSVGSVDIRHMMHRLDLLLLLLWSLPRWVETTFILVEWSSMVQRLLSKPSDGLRRPRGFSLD